MVRQTFWSHIRRLFLVDEPPLPPLGAEDGSVVRQTEQSRRSAERVEEMAAVQEARMRFLERRLQLYERTPLEVAADNTKAMEPQVE